MSRPDEHAKRTRERLVLVVDDDPRVRQSLAGLLWSAGLNVRLYGSAAELFSADVLNGAGCLITDMCMLAMDGWELQRRAASAYPHLPLIFITAYYQKPASQRARFNGAFALFYKPFDGEELIRVVHTALRVDQIRHEQASTLGP